MPPRVGTPTQSKQDFLTSILLGKAENTQVLPQPAKVDDKQAMLNLLLGGE